MTMKNTTILTNISETEINEKISLLMQGIEVATPPLKINRSTGCVFAEDTGVIAFPSIPCRGNKIRCRHPGNADFVSFAAMCREDKCKYYKRRIRL